VLVTAVLFAAVVGGRAVEMQPEFCGSCHVEREHYDRWLSSGAAEHHKSCIECHTGPGLAGIVHGQVRGVRNVVAYATGTYTVPLTASVPEEWCLKCHARAQVEAHHARFPGFAPTGCGACHNHKPGSSFTG
jgi:hypothetical protein